MSAERYTNELEASFQSLPGFLQAPLRPPFEKINEGLQWVAGQPDQLVQAGSRYTHIGQGLERTGNQFQSAVAELDGSWDGDDHEAFSQRMQQVQDRLDKLAEATLKTEELLKSCAESCTESANAIIDIVKTTVMTIVGSAVVGAVLSVVSFGASAAAAVAASLAKLAQAIGKASMIIQRLAQVLQKVATLFKKIAEILKGIKELLKLLKAIKKGMSLKGKIAVTVAEGAIKGGVRKGVEVGTGGLVDIPGAGESAKDAFDSGRRAVDAADEAGDTARGTTEATR